MVVVETAGRRMSPYTYAAFCTRCGGFIPYELLDLSNDRPVRCPIHGIPLRLRARNRGGRRVRSC